MGCACREVKWGKYYKHQYTEAKEQDLCEGDMCQDVVMGVAYDQNNSNARENYTRANAYFGPGMARGKSDYGM